MALQDPILAQADERSSASPRDHKSRVTAWRGVGVLVAYSQRIWLRIKEMTGEIKWPGGEGGKKCPEVVSQNPCR